MANVITSRVERETGISFEEFRLHGGPAWVHVLTHKGVVVATLRKHPAGYRAECLGEVHVYERLTEGLNGIEHNYQKVAVGETDAGH